MVHPSSEKGKPTERWGHKADGSEKRTAGLPEIEQHIEEDVMKLKLWLTMFQ